MRPLLLAVCLCLVLPGAAAAQGSCTIQGVIELSGHAFDVAVDGAGVYVTSYTGGLQLYDGADPTSLRLTGQLHTAGRATRVAAHNDVVYVADDQAGVLIVDVSDPGSPVVRATLPMADEVRDLVAAPGILYVLTRHDGLLIFDVEDLSEPTLLSTYALPESFSLVVSDSIAYVSSAGLYIIDVSGPGSPKLLARLERGTRGLAVRDGIIYCADFGRGLRIIDATDVRNPIVLAELEAPDAASVMVRGETVYLSGQEKGIYIVDVSDLSAPALVSIFDTPGIAQMIVPSGSFAYMPNGELHVLDLSAPRAPSLVGSSATPVDAFEVAIEGDAAFVVGEGMLFSFDISDPARPSPQGLLPLESFGGGSSVSLFVAGRMVYVTSQKSLRIFDASDLSDLKLIHVIPTDDFARDVAVRDGLACVVSDGAGLQLYDVSDPRNPVLLGSFPAQNAYASVAVDGDVAYCVDGLLGLEIIDISAPQEPTLLGEIGITPGIPIDVSVQDGVAYVTKSVGSAVQLVDVRDPTAPALMGVIVPPAATNSTPAGDRLLVTDIRRGLQLYSVRDPGAPVLIAEFDTGVAFAVDTADGMAFVANEGDGLVVVDVGDCLDCYVDCNQSGEPEFFDFLCFQELFAAGDPGADCDGSTSLDFMDLLCFQDAFAAGCP